MSGIQMVEEPIHLLYFTHWSLWGFLFDFLIEIFGPWIEVLRAFFPLSTLISISWEPTWTYFNCFLFMEDIFLDNPSVSCGQQKRIPSQGWERDTSKVLLV